MIDRMHRTAIAATAFAALLCGGAMADEPKALTPEELWRLSRIGAPIASPTEPIVIAPVTTYDVDENRGETRLWLFTTDGELQRPITLSGRSAGQATFSPCGTRLAFVSRRDGDDSAQIYILPLDGPGEAERRSEVPTGITGLKWVGEHLYFISRVWPDQSWEEMEASVKAQRTRRMSAQTWNDLPYSHYDHWIDEERQAHLFRMPANEGPIEAMTLGTGRELPRSSQSAASYDVAPDESLVVFVSDSAEDPVDPHFDLFLLAPGSTETVNLTEGSPAGDGSPLFSRCGAYLAWTRQTIRGFYGDRQRLMLHTLGDGTTRVLTDAWDRSASGLVWSQGSTHLYGSIDDAGTRRLYRFDLDGAEPHAITGETSFTAPDVLVDGRLITTHHSFLHPARLVHVDPATGAAVRLDDFNDEHLSALTLGTYESVTFTGANGAPIQMWVNYPPDFDPERSYPLFLLIHGGPHNAMVNGFHYRWNAQTFSSWGFVTAWPNFHGSSGFGQDFTDSINPDWMTKPYQDVIAATEWFAAQPWIDADRMVAGGASYGGYLTSVLVGKPHPFRALVIHAPVYNMYAQMSADFAVHATRFGGYWEDPSIYQSISPHYLAADFHTPALISHGQLDYRVPVGQAFELFRTLRMKGIDARMIYFPDENHHILKPQNSIYWYGQVRDWVERWSAPMDHSENVTEGEAER